MSMKFLQVLAIVFVAFTFEANAQLCGIYKTTLIVRKEANEPVRDTQIKIIPLQKEDYTKGGKFVRDQKDASRFSISFNEGYQVKGNYKIVVTANGFDAVEREIKFPYCKPQKFDFKLTKNDSATQTILSGTTYDDSGAVIVYATVKFRGSDNIEQVTKTDEEGAFEIKLKAGNYFIQFEALGFQLLKIEKYRIAPSYKGRQILDVVLESGENSEPCGYSGVDCLNQTPIENETTKTSDKILQKPLEKLPEEQNKSKRKNKN